MKHAARIAFVPVIAFVLASTAASAQPAPAAQGAAPAAAAQLPADPWPRVVDLSNAQVLVYQPQVNKWDGNQLDFRAALAIKTDRIEGRDVRRDLRARRARRSTRSRAPSCSRT